MTLFLLITLSSLLTSVCEQAGENIIGSVSNLPVTINFHHWCLTMHNFTQSVTALLEKLSVLFSIQFKVPDGTILETIIYKYR